MIRPVWVSVASPLHLSDAEVGEHGPVLVRFAQQQKHWPA